jgi:ankyrin repeat protein
MSSLTGETKSSSTSGNVTTSAFYTNKLPPSTNLPNDIFEKSADLTLKGIERNNYNHQPDIGTSPRVLLVNLTSQSMNGKFGTRVGWNETKKRFKVSLDDGNKTILIKAENLETVVARVRLVNLTTTRLNGKLGKRTKWNQEKSRFTVVLDDGQKINIKPINLEIIPGSPCLCERSESWKLDQCADCKKDLGLIRLAEEERNAKIAIEEDRIQAEIQPHAERLRNLGITIEALIAFAYKHDCWNWPTWKVVRDIIVPATSDTRCRYADLPELKDCFGPATVFMSHCWGAKFGDLIGAACHGARKDRVVWIDIFAVRQWPGNVADLDFRGVVKRCDALIVSTSPVDGLIKLIVEDPDAGDAFLATDEGKAAKKTIPFCRLWCIVELTAAIILNVPIVIKGGSIKSSNGSYEYDIKCIGELMNNLTYMIDVDSSECAVDADKIREMAIVRSLKGGSKGVNALVAGVVNGAVLSIGYNILEIDAFVCNEPQSFRALNIPLGCEGEERKLAIKVLGAACGGGRESIVQELLLKWNVKEDDDKEKEGETKRNDSMKKEKEKKRKWLIQLIDDSHVLWFASSGGHVRVVERILEVVGINLNVLNGGSTPILVASANGHVNVLQLLIEKGGGISGINVQRKGDGSSPLVLACFKNHIEVVQLLLSCNKIDINQPQKHGLTPLFAATQEAHIGVVALLLKAGVNVNQSRKNGFTPLLIASQKGFLDIVKQLLLVKDINLNQHANNGVTPILAASSQGHVEIVRLLLQQPNIHTNKTAVGKSALGHAISKNYTEIIQLLKAAGAKDTNQAAFTNEAALRTVFDDLDVDKDGYISFEDLRRSQMGGDSQIRAWIAERDKRGKGNVNFHEFKQYVLNMKSNHGQWSTSNCVVEKPPTTKVEELFAEVAALHSRKDGLVTAAQRGNAIAQFNLGNHYRNGKYGLPKDAKKSFFFYQLAAEKGYADAQFNVGGLYCQGGEGVEQSYVNARKWLYKAAAQGHQQAIGVLKQLDAAGIEK